MAEAPMDRKQQFVADGQRRAYDAEIEHVRTEVEAQYAEELSRAGIWNRLRIRRKIKREIRKRMRDLAPPGGLY